MKVTPIPLVHYDQCSHGQIAFCGESVGVSHFPTQHFEHWLLAPQTTNLSNRSPVYWGGHVEHD